MADKKLFLLDAYALIYRAHFAFIKNPRINSKGLNTSAVFGFTNSLLDVLNNESPTHIGIVFDTGAPTFRSDIYEEYKANRDEQPEDIAIAIPYLKKLAEGFRIPVLELDGYEADDIIATLAPKAKKEGFEVYMMTPDKDYSQCVEEDIFIYKPGRMGKPSEIWDVEKVKEKFDIEDPKQVVDIQGLTGDSVDNIPGVPGIGPKTASKLIAEFKSLEKLLDSTEQLKGKQKERLEEHAEVARLSKELATLKVDVPIAFEADKLLKEDPDKEKLVDLFKELEFRQITKRVFAEELEEQSGPVQGDLFSQVNAEVKDEEETDEGLRKDANYKLLKDSEELKILAEQIKKSKSFTFDTETDQIDPNYARPVGVSISLEAGEAFYIPVSGKNEEIQKNVVSRFPRLSVTGDYQTIELGKRTLGFPHCNRFHNFINHLLGREDLGARLEEALFRLSDLCNGPVGVGNGAVDPWRTLGIAPRLLGYAFAGRPDRLAAHRPRQLVGDQALGVGAGARDLAQPREQSRPQPLSGSWNQQDP